MLDTTAATALAVVHNRSARSLRHLLLFVATVAFSLVLLTAMSAENLVAAALLGTIAVIWAVPLRRVSDRNVDFAAADAAAVMRAVARLPGDAARVGLVLARVAIGGQARGRAPIVPFRFGTLDDRLERGRRTVAVIAGSLSPDTIVVDIVPRESTASLHRLLPPPDPDRPERLA